MKLPLPPTPGRWLGVIAAMMLYFLGVIVFYFWGQSRGFTTEDKLFAIAILQQVTFLVAIFALFRPSPKLPQWLLPTGPKQNTLPPPPRPSSLIKGTAIMLALAMGMTAAKGAEPIILLSGTIQGAQAVQPNRPQPELELECWGSVFGAGIVLGLGMGSTYVMWKMCQAKFGATNTIFVPGAYTGPISRPPPPITLTNTPSTNSIPTNNVNQMLARHIQSAQFSLFPPFPNKGSSNSPATGSNSPVTYKATWHTWTPVNNDGSVPVFYADVAYTNNCIATNNWMDTNAHPNVPYVLWCAGCITNLLTSISVNGPWTCVTAVTWQSSHGVLAALYDGQDELMFASYFTNPATCFLPLGMWSSDHEKFLRYKSAGGGKLLQVGKP